MSYTTLTLTTRKILPVVFLATAALAACQDEPPTAPAPADALAAKTGAGKPSAVETVVFSAYVGESRQDIYAMNPDGSNVRRITTDTAPDLEPDFAPGNRKIVWTRGDGLAARLYTANPDGTKQTPLTPLGVPASGARFSPDGTRIAFVGVVTDSTNPTSPATYSEIFVINADGTGLKRLTYDRDDTEDSRPTWSPDGTKLAFASTRGGAADASIYEMTADGLDLHLLRSCAAACDYPAYSPDGTRIAFANYADGTITVRTIASGAETAVGPGFEGLPEHSDQPAWTKDGAQVLFTSNRGTEGTYELYVGKPNDPGSISTVRRLTVFSPGQAFGPAYSH